MSNIFDKQRRAIYYELKHIGLEEQECHAEANIILQHITGLKYAEQITSNINQFKPDWLNEITRIIDSRRERKPLAYCLGEVEFAGLMFRIVPGVLIPRPDTETIIETVINRLETGRLHRPLQKTENQHIVGAGIHTRPHKPDDQHIVGARVNAPTRSDDIPPEPVPKSRVPIHIADIGVGCGAIAVSLLKRLPECTVWACDISELAIHCALGNARQHNVQERLTLVHGDWKKVLPNNFDVIVSNPPYLPLSAQKDLQPEIAFEPKSALFDGSKDGLSFYRQFAEKLPVHFTEGLLAPFAAFEIGDKQEQSILDIFKQNGWPDLQIVSDINSLPRVLIAAPSPPRG